MSSWKATLNWRPDPNDVGRVCWMLAAVLAAAYALLFVIDGTGADAITQVWLVTVAAAAVVVKLAWPDQFGRVMPTVLIFITVPVFTAGLWVNGWTETNPAPKRYWGIVVMHVMATVVASFGKGGSWGMTGGGRR